MSAADDYEHALGGLRGHIVYGEQTAGDTPADWVQVRVALPYLRDAERALIAERTRADAAEAECARLRAIVERLTFRDGILSRDHDALTSERDHYRERARSLRARFDWAQSVAAAAMREGLAECERLRERVARLHEERASLLRSIPRD